MNNIVFGTKAIFEALKNNLVKEIYAIKKQST